MQTIIERWGETFELKILTEKERQYCNAKNNPAQHIAARFAAKEAFAKAIATGWSGIFRWTDVEIVNEISGKPTIILHNELKTNLTIHKIFLSISHTENSVVAFVVIEKL